MEVGRDEGPNSSTGSGLTSLKRTLESLRFLLRSFKVSMLRMSDELIAVKGVTGEMAERMFSFSFSDPLLSDELLLGMVAIM